MSEYFTDGKLHGTYSPLDVQFLLRSTPPQYVDLETKEAAIQSGERHYSEMLSREEAPDERYMRLYRQAMRRNAERVAREVWQLALALADRKKPDQERVVLCSLARAGTPLGVLLQRGLQILGVRTKHYSLSIVRDRGLDLNALAKVLAGHHADEIVFVDGWTGKGAITRELKGPRGSRELGVEPFLCVLADPAGCADLAASGEDYVIPSGLLNGVVSGLLSRTFIPSDSAPDALHSVAILDHLRQNDVTRSFADDVTGAMIAMYGLRMPEPAVWTERERRPLNTALQTMLGAVMNDSGVTNINNIKPGVAEATRAVLRRVPDRVYVADTEDPEVQGIMHLTQKAGVSVLPMPVRSQYKVVTVIRGNSAE